MIVNIRKFTGVAVPSRSSELVERDMLTHPGGPVPAGLRAGPAVDRVRRRRPGRARRRCCRAARPSSTRACGSSSPRRCSRPTCPLPNVASMQTRPARADRPAVDLRRLVAGFLRMAPDVAIVGEVRDREALPAAAHAVVGRQGLHDHPRRLGPPGADPAALHLPARRHVRRAAAVGAQHAGDRERSTSSCTAPARRAGPRVTEIVLRRGPGRRRRGDAVHRHRGVPRRRRRRAPLDWTGDLPARAARGPAPTPATTSAASSTPPDGGRDGGDRRWRRSRMAAGAASTCYTALGAAVAGPGRRAARRRRRPAPARRPAARGLAGAGRPRRRRRPASSPP